MTSKPGLKGFLKSIFRDNYVPPYLSIPVGFGLNFSCVNEFCMQPSNETDSVDQTNDASMLVITI